MSTVCGHHGIKLQVPNPDPHVLTVPILLEYQTNMWTSHVHALFGGSHLRVLAWRGRGSLSQHARGFLSLRLVA